MGRKKRNEIKSAFPDMGDQQDLVFRLAYWINWYLNRETEMIRKGMQRYLDDEKLEQTLKDPKALYYPNGQRTKNYVWDDHKILFKE